MNQKYYWGAWLNPEGEWLECIKSGDHYRIAHNQFNCSEEELEERGYAKLINFHQAILSLKRLTQKQIDSSFTFMVECDYDVGELTKYIEGEVPYIVLTKIEKG